MYPSTKVDLIYYDSFYEIYVLSSSISSSRKISKSLSSFPYWKQPPPTRTKYPFETLLKLCWIHKLIWQELILLNDSNVNLELSLSFFSNDTLYLQVKFINFFVQNIFSNIIANCFYILCRYYEWYIFYYIFYLIIARKQENCWFHLTLFSYLISGSLTELTFSLWDLNLILLNFLSLWSFQMKIMTTFSPLSQQLYQIFLLHINVLAALFLDFLKNLNSWSSENSQK